MATFKHTLERNSTILLLMMKLKEEVAGFCPIVDMLILTSLKPERRPPFA